MSVYAELVHQTQLQRTYRFSYIQDYAMPFVGVQEGFNHESVEQAACQFESEPPSFPHSTLHRRACLKRLDSRQAFAFSVQLVHERMARLPKYSSRIILVSAGQTHSRPSPNISSCAGFLVDRKGFILGSLLAA